MTLEIRADIDAVSFDVFDTVLGRRWSLPADVFEAVGRRLALPDPRAFRRLRAEAELSLRRSREFRREILLAEIAAETARLLENTNVDAKKIADLELEVERQSCFALPWGLEAIREVRARRLKVAFTSDTYLPEAFIGELLEASGLYLSGDVLCISSSAGVMKSTGDLFHILAERLQLPPQRIQHVGDNYEWDILRAHAAGLRASHVTPTRANRFEAASDRDTLTHAELRGAIRAARLHVPAGLDARGREIWTIGTAVAGPLVCYFVRWCAEQAAARGIRRLYFLARDGQILHRIATTTSDVSLRALDSRYLKVSRQALLLPAARIEELEQELNWILAPTQVLTPRIALRRVGVDPADISSALARAGFDQRTWDRQLTGPSREAFRSLFADTDVIELIASRIKDARELTTSFLAQEGLFDDTPYAIVDVGWNGTLQRSIGRLLDCAGAGRPTVGFYVGLRGHRRARRDDTLVGCFANVGRSVEFDQLGNVIPIVELFVAANHGGVIGYRRKTHAVEAIINDSRQRHLLEWGVPLQQQAIEAFEMQLSRDVPIHSLDDWKSLVMEHLTRFATLPTYDEAMAYGAFEDAEDQNESYSYPLAARLRLTDALRYRLVGQLRHHNEWVAGSLILTAPWMRRLMNVLPTLVPPANGSVFCSGIQPVEGIGPEEGPYPTLSLPRFVWGYGPQTILRVPPLKQAAQLRLQLSTLLSDQAVVIEIDQQPISTVEVPPGGPRGQHPSTELTVPIAAGGSRTLVLKPRHWSTEERPLAVIITHVSVEAAS